MKISSSPKVPKVHVITFQGSFNVHRYLRELLTAGPAQKASIEIVVRAISYSTEIANKLAQEAPVPPCA